MRDDWWWGRPGPRDRYDRERERRYEGFERARAHRDDPFPPAAERYDAPYESELAQYGPARYGLGPYHERLRRRRRPDDELKHDVEEALFYDTWVNADAITVEVSDGVVTLTGELPNYDEVRFATDDAWDVDGVIGVRCLLTVDDG